MFIRNRLVAAAAVVGALAVAGPAAAGASAAPTRAAGATPAPNVPCYPYPAWCGADGQPVWFAPFWVRPALGLPPAPLWPPLSILPAAPQLPTIP